MSAIKEVIDYVKEDGEFSDCKEQIELAEKAQVEFDQLTNLKNDAHARLVELGTIMPCGHLARYSANEENGTQYCVMCVLEATQVTIMNLMHEDD